MVLTLTHIIIGIALFVIGVIGRRIVIDTFKEMGISNFSIQAGYRSAKKIKAIISAGFTGLAIGYLVMAYKKGWLDEEAQKKVAVLLFFLAVVTILGKLMKKGKFHVNRPKELQAP